MGLKLYLPLGVAAFLAGTSGADIMARMSIGGEPLAAAVDGHLAMVAGMQPVAAILLLAPFMIVTGICARAERRARRRSVLAVFAAATGVLLICYFIAHRDAHEALRAARWTAAALAIGLVPWTAGVPVALLTWGAAAIAARLDPRPSADSG
ncbi:hypothetical protein GVO57_06755 [Sphingomonas changnyeongensis]|uniref:Uncharacterized protein n=1 Tax=Sphingomonas changnyeongensis TaxID=2698679 RepID=A0A7Z2S7R2_9SPHN|nr:hypothetical protein [Sphingomonas changnyeongensis]QHL90586.1 hypothetical protein GVO57_06755 [Sphingomonas changnyeongensis]